MYAARAPAHDTPPSHRLLWITLGFAVASLLIIPLNVVVLFATERGVPVMFWVLATLQFLLGMIAAGCGFAHAIRKKTRGGMTAAAIVLGVVGVLSGLGGPIGMFLTFLGQTIRSGGGLW
jgi:hypothetical protein